MDGESSKQLSALLLNEQQLKFEYSVARFRNECARNQLWKQRNLLKRLRQQQNGFHDNKLEEVVDYSSHNENQRQTLDCKHQQSTDDVVDRVKVQYELRVEMESLQQTLKNMMSEYHVLQTQRDSLQGTVFDLEDKIQMTQARFATLKRARSLPDVNMINLKSPASSGGNSSRIVSVKPKRKQLLSMATSLRVKMSLIVLKKRAQQRIEQRKQEEHVPFPELSRRGAVKLK